MHTASVLGLLACASSCCGAFHVDHFDAQRRLTRVNFNPSIKAPEITVHYNQPPSRRLDVDRWHDKNGPGSDGHKPGSDRADVTLLVVNPEELFYQITDDLVTIYGTDITLEEHMWNADRDLVVKGGIVRLSPTMKFHSKPAWTGELRHVRIHAMEIVVPEGGATIDVSGDTGITPGLGLPAAHGLEPGEAGQDGGDGGAGGPGGVVLIQGQEISGGTLTINVAGGAGGDGQPGGDGAVGAVGQRRTDIDDCCQRTPRGQTGNPGLAGGDAGVGGNGGNGGTAGYVDLSIAKPLNASETNLQDDGSIKNVLVSSHAGAGGRPGSGGKAAHGGGGGPGIMTTCKSINIFWWNQLCTFPIGETGPEGANGTAAAQSTPGKMGPISDQGLSKFSEKSLRELRAEGNGENLRYELFYADTLYRSGSFAEAQKLYIWIEAVLHTDHSDAQDAAQDLPWRQIGLEAAVRLTQLKTGLDFWGHQLNHAPLLPFDALHESVSNLLVIAEKAEDAFDKFYEEGTTEEERKSLIVKAVKNLDYEIGQAESGIHQQRQDISATRADCLQLQSEQDRWTEIVQTHAESCDQGIRTKEIKGNSGIMPNVRRLTTLATNGWAVWGTVLAATTVGLGIWGMMAASVPDALGAVLNVANAGESSLQDVLVSNVGEAVPRVQTLVTNTISAVEDSTSAWDSIAAGVTKVQSDAGADLTRVNGIRTQTNVAVTPEDFLAIRAEYIDTIPECEPIREPYNRLRNVSEVLMNKIYEHDMHVVKFAEHTVSRSKLHQERASLMSSVAGTFDPTNVQFMQSIGQAYRSQKDLIIENLKLLHEAVDFEFCDQKPFQYEDVRVTQLASFLAQISSDRLRRHSEDTGARGVLAEHGANDQMHAITKITLAPGSADMDMAFAAFWENGTLVFNVDSDNVALPIGVANMRVVNAQAFVPELLLDESGTNDLCEVWIRRLGSSTCSTPAGEHRLFSHSASGYYSVYSAKTDPRLTGQSPTWLTHPAHGVEIVGPTPVGPWEISLPALTTAAARQMVKLIELHLYISYVPCDHPNCGANSATSPNSQSVHAKMRTSFSGDAHMPSASAATMLSLFGAAAFASLFTLSAVFGLQRRERRSVAATQRSSEQVEFQ